MTLPDASFFTVMAGLVPAIHCAASPTVDMDPRDKPEDDGGVWVEPRRLA
jgi:hypothetical protein